MLVKEMHIAFELGFQKLGSFSRRKFQPEEIDFLLNRSIDYFVRDSIKTEEDQHGFEKIQADLDRIRDLVTILDIPAFYQKDFKDYRQYIASLPSDYAYLVSDAWYHAIKCSTTQTTIVDTNKLQVVKLYDSTETDPPYFSNFIVGLSDGVDTTNFINLSGQLDNYNGYPAQDQKFEIPKLVEEIFMQILRNGDISTDDGQPSGVYFERYNNFYYPNSFIFVFPNGSLDLVLTIDGTANIADDTRTFTTTQHSAGAETDYFINTSRLVRSSKLDNILATDYYKPLKDSPVSAISQDRFQLYSHISQIVNRVTLTYIRQPQKINLLLQRNCDLAPEFHQQIVDLAVQYAAGRVEQTGLFQISDIENKGK